MKQRGKGSGLCSACSVLFAIGPCSVVLMKWRLNAVGGPFISCIKLPLAIFSWQHYQDTISEVQHCTAK